MIAVGAIGIFASSGIKNKYDLTLEYPTNRMYIIDSLVADVNQLREDANRLVIYSQWYDDDTKTKEFYDISIEHIKELDTVLVQYEENIKADPFLTEENKTARIADRNELQALSDEFEALVNDSLEYGLADMGTEMSETYERLLEIGEEMKAALQELYKIASAKTDEILLSVQHFSAIMIAVNIIILIVISLFGIIVGIRRCKNYTAKGIKKGLFNAL